jgi:HK97 gp10 family phage protein
MEIKLQGFADLDKALQDIEKQATRKAVLRRALKKAAEPMVKLAQSRVPVDKGNLVGSIEISAKLDKRQAGLHKKQFRNNKASVELFLGPSYTLGAGGRHGHLVEFGTSPHINGGKFAGTSHPGTRPQPFMRPAWDQDQQDMLDRLGEEIAADLAKVAARAARKAAKGA